MNPALNEVFGWAWITLGFLSGALLGARFHREDWLGGYASFKRRLLRLGHISFIGLGVLNILFAGSARGLVARHGSTEIAIASAAFVIGGVSMPLACALVAFRPALKPVFAAPVLSLLAGVGLLTLELVRA